MHTLLVEYAMLVDLKIHTGTRLSTFTQTVTHELMQVNTTVNTIFIFPTYVQITLIPIIIKMCQ